MDFAPTLEFLSKPVKVRRRRRGEGGKLWKIFDSETGTVKGESDSQDDAEASARARNAAFRAKQEGKSLTWTSLAKFASTTTSARNDSHAHRIELPGEPEAGTYVTRVAKSAGSRVGHVHVFVIRPGVKDGETVTSSRGIDGHTHQVTLGGKQPRGEKSAELLFPLRKQAKTKTEGGRRFRAGDYAYVPDREKPSTWKLRLTNTPGGPPDRRIVGAAIAALGPGFRGQKVQIPRAALAAVKRKVLAAWRKLHPGQTNFPSVLRGS